MSVTADYCLWLGNNRTYDSTLHRSAEVLSKAIDRVDWGRETPVKGQIEHSTVYFWSGVIGPYFKADDRYPSLECLIAEVQKSYPELPDHYSLFVWVEHDFMRVDGYYHDRNLYTCHTTVIQPFNCPDHQRGSNGMRVSMDMRHYVEHVLRSPR